MFDQSLSGLAASVGAHSIVGVGPRSIDLLPFARLGLLTRSFSYEGAPWSALANPPAVWTLEAGPGHRRNHWRAADAAKVASVVRTALKGSDAPLTVLPYSPNRYQEAVLLGCAPTIRLAANPRSILDSLHDKIMVRAALRELGVPVPRSVAVHRDEIDFAAAAHRLGLPLVAQTRSGSAGRGTYLVHTQEDLIAALAEQPTVRQWLLSSHVGDLTINIAGVVTRSGVVHIAPPAVQLREIGAGADGFGNYGGNDFAAAAELDAVVLAAGRRYTERIGTWLGGQGFLGMFGVDYVVSDGTIRAIEVNPRMQASSALLGEIELAHGQLPSSVRHLLALLGAPEADATRPEPGPAAGGQIVLRVRGGDRLVTRAPRPGRHVFVDGGLVFRAPADGLLECDRDDVVLAGMPSVGSTLADGALLVRVITRNRLASAEGEALPGTRHLADAVRAAFGLLPTTTPDIHATARSSTTVTTPQVMPSVAGTTPYPLDRGRLIRAKVGYAVRNVDVLSSGSAPLTLRTGDDVRPRAGDLMLARVTGLGHHARLQLPTTRKATLYLGDEVVVVCSARYAPDQFLAELPESLGPCHLVATGGVAANVVAAHSAMREPTRLLPLGLLATPAGQPLNLGQFAPVRSGSAPVDRPPVIVVAGNAMNTGKTTVAVHLVRGLSQAGLRVGAAKITGTVSFEDVHAMQDAGAGRVLDFTDGGYATTVGLPLAPLRGLFGGVLTELTLGGSEVIVIEVADGLFQNETAAILRDPECRSWMDGVLFATRDALSAIEGVRRLREWGLPLIGLSGILTASPLAMAETEAIVDVPIYGSSEIFAPGKPTGRLLSEPDTALTVLRAATADNAVVV